MLFILPVRRNYETFELRYFMHSYMERRSEKNALSPQLHLSLRLLLEENCSISANSLTKKELMGDFEPHTASLVMSVFP